MDGDEERRRRIGRDDILKSRERKREDKEGRREKRVWKDRKDEERVEREGSWTGRNGRRQEVERGERREGKRGGN